MLPSTWLVFIYLPVGELVSGHFGHRKLCPPNPSINDHKWHDFFVGFVDFGQAQMASIAVGRLAATKAALKGLSYLVSKGWHQPGSKSIGVFLPIHLRKQIQRMGCNACTES